jgi:hypothetical protein
MFSGTMALACLLLGANPSAPDTWFVNFDKFAIPITIDQAKLADIQEFKLWVSTNEGRNWNLAGSSISDREKILKDGFPYHAAGDGVFLFAIQVVYKGGRVDPPDIYSATGAQKIVVDKVKPDIKLTAERKGEEIAVHWNIVEQNPDPVTFRMDYVTADMASEQWTPVPAKPGPTGDVSFTPPSRSAVKVRLQLKDKAENFGQEEAVVTAGAAPAPPPSAVAQNNPRERGPNGWPPSPAPDPPGIPGGTQQPGGQLLPPPSSQPPQPLAPASPPPQHYDLPGSAVLTSARSASYGGELAPASAALPQVMVVRTPELKLEFEVTKAGPSGVGSVDVYLSTDDGQRWDPSQKDLKIDVPGGLGTQQGFASRGTVTVTLPRQEVTYGIYLVVKNGAGLGKPPPHNGEPPQMRVEVDTKVPEADLMVPVADLSRGEGALVLLWRAIDRNLDSNPITLEWAAEKKGPWKVIGSPALPNTLERPTNVRDGSPKPTGSYVWQVTSDVPGRVFLRLTVRDQAGNAAVAETSEAVVVDTTLPVFRVVGATPAVRLQ